jgi:hypothetical protein
VTAVCAFALLQREFLLGGVILSGAKDLIKLVNYFEHCEVLAVCAAWDDSRVRGGAI